MMIAIRKRKKLQEERKNVQYGMNQLQKNQIDLGVVERNERIVHKTLD